MSDRNFETQNTTQNTEAYLHERQVWIQDALEVVGADRTADPLVVFPSPEQVRAESRGFDLNTEQETALREVAGRFGIGGEVDVNNEAEIQIIEGGKPWKVEAESAISKGAKTVIFAGSPNRKLGQDETDYVRQKFGIDLTDKSEYDMVRLIARNEPAFDSFQDDQVLPFGYDIQNNYQLTQAPTGQLVRIGTSNEANVLVLRVDRENYVDNEGNDKYRNQPDSAALMGFVADVLAASGDQTSSVGMNTSNTYASRVIDAVRAGLKKEREFSVGMYGRKTIIETMKDTLKALQDKGVENIPKVPDETPINQIPGELHTIYTKLQQLEEQLEAELNA